MPTIRRKLKLSRKTALISAGIIIVGGGIVLALVLRNPNSTGNTIPSTTSTSASSSNGSSSSPSSGSDKIASSSGNTTTQSTGPNNSELKAPFGSFVSNHTPGKNGSPTEEASVCSTTPGASCYIQFTKGNTTKKLETKTTNSDGVVVWNWDIKDAGLSTGEWQITAIAELNSQTKSTQDQKLLEIQ